MAWVERHFPHIGRRNVIQAHRKELVNGDLLFDDGPKNLNNFPGIRVAMNFQYNQDAKANYWVSSWLEFEAIIQQIAGLQATFSKRP